MKGKKSLGKGLTMATRNIDKQAKKAAKKGWRALHTTTKIVVIVALLLGIAGGLAFTLLTFQNDRFTLVGETAVSLDVGEAYTYTEQGVEAVCFGRDLSGEVVVETTLEKDTNGNYIIPTDQPGVYTITYTVECFKFGKDAPNGQIKRVRVFTVNEVEEDGRNGE